MKSSTKQLLIGVGGAVAAGLILQRLTGRGGGGINPEFVSGAPYGNSIAANNAVMASAGGKPKKVKSSASKTSSSKVAGAASTAFKKVINFWPEPTYTGKNPYAYGYGTSKIDGGGALI